MSNPSVKGKVIDVLKPESGVSKSGKEWNRREFVIETDDQYPKKICCNLFGDKVNMIPSVGEDVEVSLNIESREYNGRWFHSLNAWKIDKSGQPNQVNDSNDLPPEFDESNDPHL